jgi:hypothetical protein
LGPILFLLIYAYFASMIKLGIFADQSTNPQLLEMIKALPDASIVGVNFSGNAEVPSGYQEFSSPVDLMEISDAILILSNKSISIDLIKLMLRKSKHIYLSAIPNLNVKEIKELLDFEKEAGIVSYIYNRFNYFPFFDRPDNKLETPILINLRTCFEGKLIKPSLELLLLITALNHLVKSNYKKLEIFALNESASQLIVNLRIEYSNGCVINLTISQENSSGCCEIFSKSWISRIDFNVPLYISYPQMNQELVAIEKYLGLIRNKDHRENSFDNLMKGVQIMHEIREYLRFNGIDF